MFFSQYIKLYNDSVSIPISWNEVVVSVYPWQHWGFIKGIMMLFCLHSHACVGISAADSWGQTTSNQLCYSFENCMNVHVSLGVHSVDWHLDRTVHVSIGVHSFDWLLERTCLLNRRQKCISIEMFSSCSNWALPSAKTFCFCMAAWQLASTFYKNNK